MKRAAFAFLLSLQAALGHAQTSGALAPAADPWKRPRTPSALDDEFDGAALLPKWSILQPSGLTAAVARGLLKLTGTTHAGDIVQGPYQDIPSGGSTPFTCAVHIRHHSKFGSSTQYGTSGILLVQDMAAPSTTDLVSFGPVVSDDNNYGDYLGLYVGKFSKFDTNDGTNPHRRAAFLPNALFLRVRRSGTTWYFDYSADGTAWIQVHTMAESFTAKQIGVFVDNNNTGQDVSAYFDFFRFKAAADDGPLGGG